MTLGIPLHPDTNPVIAVSEHVEIKRIFVKSSSSTYVLTINSQEV